MSLIHRALLQMKDKTPMVEWKRFRGKINIQRPRKPHYVRQLVLDVCKPTYPKKPYLSVESCDAIKKKEWKKPDNPLEHILAKECLNWFNHSKMVAFFHANPVQMVEKYETFADLKLQNMHMKVYGKRILKMGLEGTHFDAVYKLFHSQTQIVFSDDVQVKNLLKIMKKLPQFILLAGVLDGKFVSRNEFLAYSNLPSLDVSRAQLCNVFQQAGSNLVSQITRHQMDLVGRLDQYVQIQKDSDGHKDKKDTEE